MKNGLKLDVSNICCRPKAFKEMFLDEPPRRENEIRLHHQEHRRFLSCIQTRLSQTGDVNRARVMEFTPDFPAQGTAMHLRREAPANWFIASETRGIERNLRVILSAWVLLFEKLYGQVRISEILTTRWNKSRFYMAPSRRGKPWCAASSRQVMSCTQLSLFCI